jgi:peptidoglycan/xylan/chitin deacetylase (PgdA/CDA1 family)
MYTVTLSWDDGFRESTEKIARIYERFGFRADFNIVATYHRTGQPGTPGVANSGLFGDFGWWNELHARGHFIHPHGLDHSNKAALPLATAQEKILACLDIFSREMPGFDPYQAVFAFPYNASSPEIETWLAGHVRAFRTSGPGIQPFPSADTCRITTTGREDSEACLDECLEKLFALPEGWLVYTVHGLDGEGWGPMRSEYLERLLTRLRERPDVSILPVMDVLSQATR